MTVRPIAGLRPMGLRSPAFRVVTALLAVALVGLLLQGWVSSGDGLRTGASGPAVQAPLRPAGGTGADGIDAQRVVDEVSHQVTAAGDGTLTAGDGAYRARFDAAGFTISDLTVSLAGLRHGETEVPLALGSWSAEGTAAARVVAPGVTERVTARDGEVEWDVVLDRPLPGAGPLTVEATLPDALGRSEVVRHGRALRVRAASGGSVLIDEMIVKDAHGTELYRALPRVHDGTLRLDVPRVALHDAAYPVTIDPTVSPEQPLGIAPAPDDQFAPAVAFDGANYLVVWADLRGGPFDVYGARVTPGGAVLDPSGIAISTATNNQFDPTVAFDGTNYLVAWADLRGGTASDVYGARVTPGGAVLDPSGIAISTATLTQAGPTVAFDGTNYLVVWDDLRGGPSDVYGARVTPAGAVLDPSGIAISTATNSQFDPAVAFDGTNYLVAWTDLRSGSGTDVYGARVTPGGAVLDPSGIAISTATNAQTAPTVAFDGTNYLVAWQDIRSGTSHDVYGARVTPGGAVLDASGIAISTATDAQTSPTVAFDGTNYLVAWTDLRSGSGTDVYGARVTPGGAVLDPSGIAISAGTDTEVHPTVAFDGTNYLVNWAGDTPSNLATDVYGSRVQRFGPTPVLDPSGILVSSIARQSAPVVAFDGTNYLVVWQDFRSGTNSDVYATRVTPAGVVLDPTGIAIATGAGDQSAPAVAFDGSTNYTVVWQASGSGGADVFSQRVSQAGALVGGVTSIAATSATEELPAIAHDVDSYLVVWQSRSTSGDRNIKASILSNTGVVFDFAFPGTGLPVLTLSNTNTAESPAVAAAPNATTFLVTWQDLRPGTGYDVYGTRFVFDLSNFPTVPPPLPDGNGFVIANGADDEFAPSVGADGTNWLVAWSVVNGLQLDVRGKRVSPAGALLDAAPGIPISTGTGDQDQPAVAFNGAFLVLWRDRRSGNADIFGGRVTSAGATQDGTGFVVSTGPGEDARPTVVKGTSSKWGAAYDRGNQAFFRTVSSK